jgi:hypothetical protein
MEPAFAFRYESAAGTGLLRLPQEPWKGKSWLVRLSVCAEPSCRCPNVELECTPEDSRDPDQGFCFWLDVDKRELSPAGDPIPSPESFAFGRAVAAELAESDWQTLSDYMKEAKDRQIRLAVQNEGSFPEEALSGQVSMVGYAEVFPRASSFVFEIDSARWLADDQYCINPGCRCRETLLSFIPLSNEATQDGIPDAPAAFYEYNHARFTPANESADQPSLAALVRRLRQAHPGLDQQLKQRHREIRALFRRALQERLDAESGESGSETPSGVPSPAPTRPARAEQIGRNEPCPCGSGKKFKKCCGK